jgi:esterase
MKLNYRQHSDQGEPLVILHGLFGSLKNWNRQARLLAETFKVFSLDLRNHGSSAHDDYMSYPVMAEDVMEFLNEKEINQAHVLGHSMGGKVAMQMALSYPQRIAKLVIVDIAPVAYAGNRGGHDDIFEGLSAVEPGSLSARNQADEILAGFIPDKSVRQFLLTNLEHEKQGFRWRFNLSALKANYDNLRGNIVADKPFEKEVYFVKGALSNYITNDDQDTILTFFPKAKVKVVVGAGHWVHAEKPEMFFKIIKDFLIKRSSSNDGS